MTCEELSELCGPGIYRIYALDEVGKVLVDDEVARWDLTSSMRELRNGASEMLAPLGGARTAASTQASDLRFALEAIVQMMRVNGDALRAVAESQADWVKSIASVRGFFRNGAPPPRLPSPQPANDDDGHDDEGDDEPEPPPSKGFYDVVAPIVETLAPTLPPLMMKLFGGGGSTGRAVAALPSTGASGGAAADLAHAPGFETRELFDLNYAAAKGKAKREARQPSGTAQPAMSALQARLMSDPKLLAHFMAVQPLLSAEDVDALMALAGRASAEDLASLVVQLEAHTPAEAAALLHGMLVELRSVERATEPNDTTLK